MMEQQQQQQGDYSHLPMLNQRFGPGAGTAAAAAAAAATTVAASSVDLVSCDQPSKPTLYSPFNTVFQHLHLSTEDIKTSQVIPVLPPPRHPSCFRLFQ
jgi:hypothetical protein